MGKKRKDDEVELLRQENRELKSTNRQLMKQLKKINKGYNKIREEETDENELEEPIDTREKCPNCNGYKITSNTVKLPNGKSKTLVICSSCGYKKAT